MNHSTFLLRTASSLASLQDFGKLSSSLIIEKHSRSCCWNMLAAKDLHFCFVLSHLGQNQLCSSTYSRTSQSFSQCKLGNSQGTFGDRNQFNTVHSSSGLILLCSTTIVVRHEATECPHSEFVCMLHSVTIIFVQSQEFL